MSDAADDELQQLIIVTSISVIAAIVFLICVVLFAVCMWRYCKRAVPSPPVEAPPGPDNFEAAPGSRKTSAGLARPSNKEEDQTDGVLLLPVHVQSWLDVHHSTARRGIKNLSREDIVHFAPKQRLELMEVSQSKICLLSEISESNIGKIYRAEASRLRGDEVSTTVLVKSLREMADDHTLYQDFRVEMVWASGFDHPNVLQLLAVCTHGDPKYMVYEYLEFGNLLEFLRSTALVWLEMDLQSRASLASFGNDNDSRVYQQQNTQHQQLAGMGNEEMVAIAIQITDGLNYISNNKIVLKDIAARNCQVGKGLCVKIADFGLSHKINSEDYCRIRSKDSQPVPLRWLSPEAIHYNRFSEYSDIWSYGVLLWEVFSLGERPYGHMTNAETAKCILQCKTLDKPAYCTDDVFGIMNSCWAIEPNERSGFATSRDRLARSVDKFDISSVSRRFSMKPPLTPDLVTNRRHPLMDTTLNTTTSSTHHTDPI